MLTIITMLMKKLFGFCGEELRRMWSAVRVAYRTLREMDEMALGTLLAYLRDR